MKSSASIFPVPIRLLIKFLLTINLEDLDLKINTVLIVNFEKLVSNQKFSDGGVSLLNILGNNGRVVWWQTSLTHNDKALNYETAAHDILRHMIQEEETQTEGLPREELRDIIDLSLWIGQLLLQHGAESARVEETVHLLGTGLGATWLDVFTSAHAIIITTSSGEEFRTKIRRVVRFGGVNMSVIESINRLSRQVQEKQLDRFAVRQALEQIDKAPHHYNRWLTAAMAGLACAAFSRLFGGDWLVFAVTFTAATAAGLIRQELRKHFFNPLLVVLLTAGVAGLISALGVRLQWGNQPAIALAASVLLLVPGVPLINAAEDLLQGHLGTGVSRGITGALIALNIAAGLALAIEIIGLKNPWPTFVQPPSIWQDALWAAVAALGFALLFNVPPRLLGWCAACGALGHGVRFLLLSTSWLRFNHLILATFVGATAVGVAATLLARRLKAPSPIFAITGIIPMVPGTFAFGTMIGVLRLAGLVDITSGNDLPTLLANTTIDAINTGLVLAALALGIALPTLLFKRPRPVV